MTLREEFDKQRDARVSERLTALARDLKRSLEQAVKKNPHNVQTSFDIKEIKNSNYKSTPGYKALHDACKAADVKIEVRGYSDSLVITINRPYKESPDYALFNKVDPPAPVAPPKKPAAPAEPPSTLDVIREKAKSAPKPKAGPITPPAP